MIRYFLIKTNRKLDIPIANRSLSFEIVKKKVTEVWYCAVKLLDELDLPSSMRELFILVFVLIGGRFIEVY